LKQFQNDRADISFYDVIETLENSLELRKIIFQRNGFYFLKGRDEIIKKHIWRKKIADEKWKKARRIIWFFDRHGNVTRDKICLNHYIIDKSLEIPFKSLYNAQSYARLVPIIDKNGFVFRQFQKANSWIKDYLIFWPESRKGNLRIVRRNKGLSIFAECLEMVLNNRIGNSIEKILAKYEKERIEKNPLKGKPGGRIVADDTQLEFHPNSPEVRIIQGFNARMKKLGFLELACQKDSGLVK